jgi:hypothetical protein
VTKPKRAKTLLPATEVPEFSSIEEAAAWYDTHDTSALPSEPVEDYPGSENWPRGFEHIILRLTASEAEKLRRRAAKLKIDYTTYVRLLINRHVLREPPMTSNDEDDRR